LAAVSALASLLLLGSTGTYARPSATHGGIVIDRWQARPLAKANVTEWKGADASQPELRGDCVVLSPLRMGNQAQSLADGSFSLSLDFAAEWSTVAYCASGFWPKIDRLQRPKKLTPLKRVVALLARSDGGVSDDQYYAMLVDTLVTAMNDGSYLRAVNSKGFELYLRESIVKTPGFSNLPRKDVEEVARRFADAVAAWDRLFQRKR
jgi:hypothetical protein